MIVPVVSEEEWLERLQGAPLWAPPGIRTIIIAPHPDDETLGAGGLIAGQRRLGVPVSVVAVTDGDAAYANVPDLAVRRRVEQDNALEILDVRGSSIVRFGLPDSLVAKHEEKLTELLIPLVQQKPVMVVAPWPLDWHPDHEACGRATEAACKKAGAQVVFYLFWTWHSKPLKSLAHQPLRRLELDHQLLTTKLAALQCHRSQLVNDDGPPVLPESLLGPARRSFETFIVHEY